MKITEMLQREDFYAVNEKTLNSYYQTSARETTLYVYPKLNAIVCAKPAKQVIRYLLCEYSVRGNPARRSAVRAYVRACLHSRGKLASQTVRVHASVGNAVLIYPCNKKYRIFHFDESVVDVIPKHGFSDEDLRHEIEFRTKKDLPSFVPTLLSAEGMGYREKIIDGKPLARMKTQFEHFRDEAYRQLRSYAEPYNETVNCKEYCEKTAAEILRLAAEKSGCAETVAFAVGQLLSLLSADSLELTFSHGDLQAGNIWIENQTNKLYIIDWESWGTRSVFYDKATLYDGLRPGNIETYLNCGQSSSEKAVVLLEDLVFQLKELNSLPSDFGTDKFSAYVSSVHSWLDRVTRQGGT